MKTGWPSLQGSHQAEVPKGRKLPKKEGMVLAAGGCQAEAQWGFRVEAAQTPATRQV